MKILLINPNATVIAKSYGYKKFFTPMFPASIAYIASVLLENGFNNVKIVDQFAEQTPNHILIDYIIRNKFDVVGISCLSLTIGNVKALIKDIKQKNPKIKIVIGNIHAIVFGDKLLKEGDADFVITGEGEYAFSNLIKALEQNTSLKKIKGISFLEKGSIIKTPPEELIKDLDSLPYPAWHLFKLNLYRNNPMVASYRVVLPIVGSRGCPYHCKYCSQDFFLPYPRYRKISKIVDEIEYMYKNYGVRDFGFYDSFFPFNKKTGMEFCEELIKRGLHKKISWMTEARVDSLDEELIYKMKQAGLRIIFFGFEAGNQKVLDSISKDATLTQAEKTVKACKKVGILILGFFMLGLPYDTYETCLETITFAKKLDCDIAKFNLTTPYPGSQMYEEVKGSIVGGEDAFEKLSSWIDWSGAVTKLIYTPPALNSRELISLQRRAMFEYYVRPSMIYKFLFKKIATWKYIYTGGCFLTSYYIKSLIKKFLIKD